MFDSKLSCMVKTLFEIATSLLTISYCLLTDQSHAQIDTFKNFNGINGSQPNGSLISDDTYLYGMTYDGGIYGKGNVFKIKPDGTGFDTLTSFNASGTYGANPHGSLLLINDTL